MAGLRLLGKRPFANRADEMDKWLDETMGKEKSAPPPLEGVEDIPAPAVSKAINIDVFGPRVYDDVYCENLNTKEHQRI